MFIRIYFIFFAIICSSCQRENSVSYDELNKYCSQVEFNIPLRESYPVPVPDASKQMILFVRSNYMEHVEIRQCIVKLFLQFDKKLLEHGLIDFQEPLDGLMGTIFVMEAKTNSMFLESSSTTLMREHIKHHLEWFGIKQNDDVSKLLTANERMLDLLMKNNEHK